jgi:hypothetical protein
MPVGTVNVVEGGQGARGRQQRGRQNASHELFRNPIQLVYLRDFWEIIIIKRVRMTKHQGQASKMDVPVMKHQNIILESLKSISHGMILVQRCPIYIHSYHVIMDHWFLHWHHAAQTLKLCCHLIGNRMILSQKQCITVVKQQMTTPSFFS